MPVTVPPLEQHRIKGPGVKDGKEGTVSEFEINVYTLLYFKWRTKKDPLYSTGSSAPCCAAAWMGGEFGGEGVHVSVWLSPSLFT